MNCNTGGKQSQGKTTGRENSTKEGKYHKAKD